MSRKTKDDNQKRKSSDYPQLAFRITESQKNELMELIKEVVSLINKEIPRGEHIFRKNDITIEALKRGLAEMKNNSKKVAIAMKQ